MLAAQRSLAAIKTGEPRAVASLALSLLECEHPNEVQLFGLQLLQLMQHVAQSRWADFSGDERQQLARMVFELLQGSALRNHNWPIRSKTAALLVEVVRQEGPQFWKDLLPVLLESAGKSPAHAEVVAMVLQFVPEDVTLHSEDIARGQRRGVLLALTTSLPDIFLFLYQALSQHFSAAMAMVEQNDVESAKRHAAVVTAALSAACAYADWAPISAMGDYNLINACCYLLRASEFRLAAVEFLKMVASRKRPADDAQATYDATMVQVFDGLTGIVESNVQSSGGLQSKNTLSEQELVFAERVCQAMVALAPHNLVSCIKDSPHRLEVYLLQVLELADKIWAAVEMLWFFQHPSFVLHSLALPLWLTLLRESFTSVQPEGAAWHGLGGGISKDRRDASIPVKAEVVASLLDVVAERLPRKGPEEDEYGFEELTGSPDYAQHRSRLIELIRLVTQQHPLLTASKVAQKLEAIITPVAHASARFQGIPSAVIMIGGCQVMLETMMAAIPDTVLADADLATPTGSGRDLDLIIQRMLQMVLAVNWQDPQHIEMQGRLLDSFRPQLRHKPQAALVVVQKLFSFLFALSALKQSNDFTTADLAILHARVQVCTSILRIARIAGAVLVPHIQDFVVSLQRMRQQNVVGEKEHNLLGEALMMIGSAAGVDEQAQVLNWLLSPVRDKWADQRWQHLYLSSGHALARLLSSRLDAAVDGAAVCAAPSDNNSTTDIWWIYNAVTLFEKALRRAVSITGVPGGRHPLLPHLEWILPPLLQLLRCIQSLWTPAMKSVLPKGLQLALLMGPHEQAALLGAVVPIPALQNEADADADGSSLTIEMATDVNSIRAWLKGIRDSGYNAIGAAAMRMGDAFFESCNPRVLDISQALLEGLDSMEHRHQRQLLRIIIGPILKHCPPAQWHAWLRPLIPPIVIHNQKALSIAWATLKSSAETSAMMGGPKRSGSEQQTNVEVLEEKLLRDFTREACGLLMMIASVRTEVHEREGASHEVQAEAAPSEAGQQGGDLLSFFMSDVMVAEAALRLATEAMNWPDSDSAHKALSFCNAMAAWPALTTQAGTLLLAAVAKEVFLAGIQGLTLESNSSFQSELVGLLREIYIRLSPFSSAPREILMCLPLMTLERLAAFEKDLLKTSSVREQRQSFKSLLLGAGGDQLKALLAQRNPTVISNLTVFKIPPCAERAVTGPASGPIGGADGGEQGAVGLASFGAKACSARLCDADRLVELQKLLIGAKLPRACRHLPWTATPGSLEAVACEHRGGMLRAMAESDKLKRSQIAACGGCIRLASKCNSSTSRTAAGIDAVIGGWRRRHLHEIDKEVNHSSNIAGILSRCILHEPDANQGGRWCDR
eukprot:SM000009S23638  [mRNA]  locus=s9:1311908:1321866:+ [translate_table: standard]